MRVSTVHKHSSAAAAASPASPACTAAHKSLLSVHTNPAKAKNKRCRFSSDGFLGCSTTPLITLVLISAISYAAKQEGATGFAAKLFAQMGELRTQMQSVPSVYGEVCRRSDAS